ncbi:MAG: hypothetical protein PHT02_00495 [Tissierellia bacterium]|nr:hypothetical protein [Tissierellia bacterium]
MKQSKKTITYDYKHPPIKFDFMDKVEEYSINEFDIIKLNETKEKGYCDYCYCFNHCRWFCDKEINKNHNPIEPCYIREYEKENINEL